MADQAGDIAKVASALAGDPNGDYTTEEFYVPLLQFVQDRVVNQIFANPNITRLKLAIVIPNVPAGTTDLSKYFDPKAAPSLALLEEIVSIREKPAGADDSQYQLMTGSNDLPIRVQTGFNGSYVWEGDNILLPGALQATDIRIFGMFDVQPIKDGESPTIPKARAILEACLASMICGAHDNEKKEAKWEGVYQQELAQFQTNIFLEMQLEDCRQRPYGDNY